MVTTFEETCAFCGGEGVVANDACIICEGAGVEVFAHHPAAPPHAGCEHEHEMVSAGGALFCDSCGCPLPSAGAAVKRCTA